MKGFFGVAIAMFALSGCGQATGESREPARWSSDAGVGEYCAEQRVSCVNNCPIEEGVVSCVHHGQTIGSCRYSWKFDCQQAKCVPTVNLADAAACQSTVGATCMPLGEEFGETHVVPPQDRELEAICTSCPIRRCRGTCTCFDAPDVPMDPDDISAPLHSPETEIEVSAEAEVFVAEEMEWEFDCGQTCSDAGFSGAHLPGTSLGCEIVAHSSETCEIPASGPQPLWQALVVPLVPEA